MELNEQQKERYSRQTVLEEIGEQGQKKLLSRSVLVVGAGGLGSAVLSYLGAAGVGRICIADGGILDLPDLQRQIIHGTKDIDRQKVLSAQDFLNQLNPDCQVDLIPECITDANIWKSISGQDLVLDCSDNFATRFIIADHCWMQGVTNVSASVLQYEGQLMTFVPGDENPCYRCFLPEMPPEEHLKVCHRAGILGSVAGVMGTLQATEAIKVLLSIGDNLAQRLLLFDGLSGTFSTLKRTKNPSCPSCGVAQP